MNRKKSLAVMGLVLASVMSVSLVACSTTPSGTEGGGDQQGGQKTTYTVTFDANGGSLTGNATLKVEEGGKITGAPTATKAEHTFDAWYDSATGGVKIVLDTYTVTKDVTLYAQYTPDGEEPPPPSGVKITFDANGGTFGGGKTTIEKTPDSDGIILDAEDPTRENYRFDAWYTEKTGGTAVDPMFETMDKTQTLYAHWVRQYTITFDAHSGTLEGNATVKADEGGKIVGAPTASKAGNDFYGWFTAGEGGDKIDLNTYTVDGDITLHAQFGEYSMPLKVLKNKDGAAVGYRIEAENSKLQGEPNSDNQAHPGEFLEDVAGASGGHSIGYFGKKDNSMTYTFKSAAAGKATLSLIASSAQIHFEWGTEMVIYPEDQVVTTAMLSVKVNGKTINFESASLRGSYENWVFNKYWDIIELGEVDIVAGTNTLEVVALQDSTPNFDCLDIETELTLTSVSGEAASGEATQPEPPAPDVVYEKAVSGKLVVVDHAGGPAVEKAVLTFEDDITAETIATNPFTVGGMGAAATDKVYLSDANGEELKDATTSKNVTVEYAYSYSGYGPAGNVSPFNYNSQTGRNTWKDAASYALAVKGLTIGETTYTKFGGTFTAEYSIPVLDAWDLTGTYTDGEITLKYASYTPVAEGKTDNKPLIVWLHGAGEGGTDPSITLLGNQVVNLAKPLIQKYFTTDTCAGAYVLAPQSPTMWMDNGDGQQGGNTTNSIYTESLFKLIKNFVDTHTDIDANRVYVGGCSNGGFMTMDLLISHPDYFAAAYPIATPYTASTEDIAKIKDIPIWFTHAKADTTVKIGNYSTPANWWEQGTFEGYANINTNQLYIDLLAAGATNVHYSLFDTVTIAAGDPDATTYMGHYSWVFTLRDECLNVQATTGSGANGAFTLADITETATNTVTLTEGGEAVTLWAWLAAQVKAAA